MTPRQTWTALCAACVAVIAGTVRLASSSSIAAAGRAALAGLLAAGVIALALSLVPGTPPAPGAARLADGFWRGLVVGGFFVGAGLLSWTFTDRPIAVWGLLLVEAAVFAVWSWPWLRELRPAARLGTAWLGVAYWLLGIVGALLVAHWQIAAERLAYAGVFGLAVLAVLVRGRLKDLTAGIATAFVLAAGVVLLAGAGNLFESVHPVPGNGWGYGLTYRFWGGAHLFYQPNSLAALVATAAIRIGVDRAYAVWQRVSVTALAGFVVYATNSRTGFVILAGAAVVHAVLLYRPRLPGLPEYGRRRLVAVVLPFVVLAAVFTATVADDYARGGSGGGRSDAAQERYEGGGYTSGRLDTWLLVLSEWRDAGTAEKLFGDATTTRAVVIREGSGDDVQLTTDNAAVGALRRGGVLGVAAFLLGLGLLLRHTLRRDNPAWYVVAVLASLPPIMTSDALLGGTGGTVWVLLLAGEAHLAYAQRPRPADTPPPPTAAAPATAEPTITEPTFRESTTADPTTAEPTVARPT